MYGSWRNAMSRVARPIFITTGWKARGDTIRLWITKDVYVRTKWDDITRLTKLFEKNKTNVDYYCNGV